MRRSRPGQRRVSFVYIAECIAEIGGDSRVQGEGKQKGTGCHNRPHVADFASYRRQVTEGRGPRERRGDDFVQTGTQDLLVMHSALSLKLSARCFHYGQLVRAPFCMHHGTR